MTNQNISGRRSDEIITCTWDIKADCINCKLDNDLDCKWNIKHLIRFYKIGIPFFIPAALGMILAGLWARNWTGLIIYVEFWIVFFEFFETRVLCRHCPFYAENGKILHCLANHGLLNVWRYTPGPMNKGEKIGLLIGFILFFSIPVLTIVNGTVILIEAGEENLGILILGVLAILTIGGVLFAGRNLTLKVCTRCVNFSCPLNRVSKHIVDSYLLKNPVMRKAWEETGYRLD